MWRIGQEKLGKVSPAGWDRSLDVIAGFQQEQEGMKGKKPMVKLSRQGLECVEGRAGVPCDEHFGDEKGIQKWVQQLG